MLDSKTHLISQSGNLIKISEMKNSEVIGAILYLEKNRDRLKRNRDLQMIDINSNALWVLKESIQEAWEQDPHKWLKSTDTYRALVAEVEKRDIGEFLKLMRKWEG